MTPLVLFVVGFVGLITSTTLVALLRRWASWRRLLDLPNERSLHSQPTPLGGGLAIVAVVVGGMALCALVGVVEATPVLAALGGGAVLVAAVSWLDDLRGLPVVMRLLAQGAAAVMVVSVGAWPAAYPLAGATAGKVAGVVLALLWIVGLTNAYNFMDGIDGIAGSQAVVAGLGWLALTWGSGRVETWLGLLLAAASLGFLIHNWPPAKIFMGDVGSAFLGLSFAALAINAARHDLQLGLAGALLVWPFVFDTNFTFLRRLRKGENVFLAHRSHLYQRLVLAGYSHRFVTCLYGALAVVGVVLALVWVRRLAAPTWLVPSVLAPAMIGLWLFVVWAERRQGAGAMIGPDNR